MIYINQLINEFLDSFSSYYFVAHILQATRVNSNSKTLIDNIFSNMSVPKKIYGNLTGSVSDSLLEKIDSLLDIYVSLKKISKYN